jgi:putative transposase
MPKNLKRYYGRGHLHFLTFSCYRRLPLLNTSQSRDAFVEALAAIRERYKFLLVGYVVMPNHVHLLISESGDCTPSVILKVLKQRVSRDLRAGTTGNLPSFWQPRFYDFNVWSEKKFREELDYMHANPITKRLVEDPKDWPWSSWSFYFNGDAGLIAIDPFGASLR